MARYLLLDEFHLAVTAPRGVEEAAYLAIRRVLDGKRFQAKLKHVIVNAFWRQPNFGKVRVRLSR